MGVTRPLFPLFLLCSAVLYYLVPKKHRWLVLLAAGAVFYLASGVETAAYLAVTIVVTWLAALAIEKVKAVSFSADATKEEKAAARKKTAKRAKIIASLCLVFNFATLALFKYLGFFFENINALLGLAGIEHTLRAPSLLLPLGISFYIFQSAGYILDVKSGKAKAQKNLAKYALFVSFFPQMIQGPINRYGELMPQLENGSDFDAGKIKSGICLIIWGLLRKVFIADVLAGAVKNVYTSYLSYPGAVVFLGVVLYCVQLYCDFAGGIDVVRGAARIFGIEMAENFRRPYFARSLSEFWRRWHMSLGEWMKDYLFYPLALSKWMGKLSKTLRTRVSVQAGRLAAPCISTFIVFLVVGIWQGPGWSNIAYGLWNGALMSLALALQKPISAINEKIGFDDKKVFVRIVQTLRTLLLVILGRYFSGSSSLIASLKMLWRTVKCFARGGLNTQTLFSFGLSLADWVSVIAGGAILFCVSLLQERGKSPVALLDKKPRWVQALVIFLAVFALVAKVYLNQDFISIAFVYENI